MYGFTTAMTSRLCQLPVGASVTAWGREYLMKTADFVGTNYPESTVVYGDTDSVMVLFPSLKDVPSAFELGNRISKEVGQAFLPPEMELENEGVMGPSVLAIRN